MIMEAWVRSERMAIFPMLLLVEFPHNKTTPDSLLAILLPLQEADAKQNEGERNTYPQHLAGGQTQQSNGSNANGYKANSYHNGNQ